MEFLKCRDVRWKRREKRNKLNVVATTAKHPDSRSKISRYGWMQPTYMRSVSFWGKFTSGSRIRASRSDLLKLSHQEGEVNTSNLADPMIMAIITSRRKKRANAYNFPKWRPRLSLIQLFVADFSNQSSLKWYCIWISRSNYHFSFLRGK